MSVERVNAAIRQLLDDCCAADNPLACLAENLDRLRKSPEWAGSEVDEVETTTLRILKALLGLE
jgi:hypothetical protein